MEFEGTVLQPNFREKEKRYNATIADLKRRIGEIDQLAADRLAEILSLQATEKELKDENKALRFRFRNFKAQVKAPRLKEQDEADQ